MLHRELKRVPIDFDWPIGKVWEGYDANLTRIQKFEGIVERVPEVSSYRSRVGSVCDGCMECHECSEKAPYCILYNRNLKTLWYKEPPTGEGYQLWETTSEGSPISPVFACLDELCGWCAENASPFASFRASKEEWMELLDTGDCYSARTDGCTIFV